MQYQFFHILAMDAEAETVRLNQYLKSSEPLLLGRLIGAVDAFR